LQAIEQQQGRVRLRRWGERTLDLDILLYGTQEINLPDLVVPHLCLTERAFVLLPLYEIAPELIVPRYGAIAQLLAEVGNQGLQQLNTAWH
jgi:2-amino-4-hydroxy-6-hydroxymethyldihydropteridine diphosphokinase